jgi:hypothetical protein
MGNLIDLLFSHLFENKSSKKTGNTYIHKEKGTRDHINGLATGNGSQC